MTDKIDTATLTAERDALAARVAGLIAERDYAFDWAKTQHAAADEYAARVKAAKAALAAARDDALEEAAQAVPQGWCQPDTRNIEMDVVLCQGIQAAIHAMKGGAA